jgi:alpha/beta superfamily hydrolase
MLQTSQAVDWGLRTPSTSNIFMATFSFGATLFVAMVSTCRTQQVWGKDECKGFIGDWALSI